MDPGGKQKSDMERGALKGNRYRGKTCKWEHRGEQTERNKTGNGEPRRELKEERLGNWRL